MIHQPNYNMLDRWIESNLLGVTERMGLGVIAFCPLAQGQLTSKYLAGIPEDSRAKSTGGFLKADHIKPETLAKVRKLNDLAKNRGQSLAQMALAWTLRPQAGGQGVTSALIGASRPEQIKENVAALNNAAFSAEELAAIDAIVK
jgi:L-glyceraldehyde 3-phosphate reductase